jgi:CDP-4-dehydro-6-deoxyglucose reductase/ferredoxin-NAD(P)+ reductase (naphthalene dioxygenase ferredoxin-specific)
MSDRDTHDSNPPRTLSCNAVGVARPGPGITVVRLEAVSGETLAFSAGQYARVTFPDLPPRDYSMANRPDEPLLEFHIRDTNRAGGERTLFDHLSPGDRATVEGPFGDAWLRESHAGPILAIAGGSGIALAKSIVETALVKGMHQRIHLYLGVRSEAELYLDDHFFGLAREYPNFRFTPVLSDADGQKERRRGLVGDAVAEDFAELKGWMAYVAGPPAMIEATVRLLAARGMGPGEIHCDAHVAAAD